MTQALPRLVDDPDAWTEEWPDAPRVHHGDETWARSLFSHDDVGTLLDRPGFAATRVRVTKNNAFVDPSAYTTGDFVVPPAVRASLESGASLLLTALNHDWKPLAAFCGSLTTELGRPVWANSYLTPPSSQGFTHHWDDHASFLVQTHGTKTWELYPPLVQSPASPHSFTQEELATLRAEGRIKDPADQTRELDAGDVLWLPHGWIHNGYTTTDWSLHVTLGLGAVSNQNQPATSVHPAQ